MNKDAVAQLLRQVRTLNNKPLQIVPATDDQIHTFEVAHRVEMPEELKAWLRLCNGAAVNPGGLYSLFSDQPNRVSMDWYLQNYPAWRQKNWFPIAGDGCGDVYVLMGNIKLLSTGTHPIGFLDQSDFSEPEYVVASGVWRFLHFLLQNQMLSDAGKDRYWPFDEKTVLAIDPDLVQCKEVPLPWDLTNDE